MSPSRMEVWTERMARYRDSSLTVKAFCAREGVSQPGFYQWKKKLAQAESAASFVPVSLNAPSAAMAIVRLPGGAEVELLSTISPDQIERILAAVVTVTDLEGR